MLNLLQSVKCNPKIQAELNFYPRLKSNRIVFKSTNQVGEHEIYPNLYYYLRFQLVGESASSEHC